MRGKALVMLIVAGVVVVDRGYSGVVACIVVGSLWSFSTLITNY
jgi:hypothetical protein